MRLEDLLKRLLHDDPAVVGRAIGELKNKPEAVPRLIGWLEAVTGLVAGTEFREIAPYILVLLVLLVRPTGLFGTKEVERI